MNYRKAPGKFIQLETLTSFEVKHHLLAQTPVAVIPVGSCEQHGPHAPLGTDTFISIKVGERLATRLGGIVTPPVYFGVSGEHMDFPGTITISPETLRHLLADIISSLSQSGFKNIVVLNGHGGNEKCLQAVRESMPQGDFKLVIISYWDKLAHETKMKLSSIDWGLHANEYETSIIAAIFPGMVKKMRNIDYIPDEASFRNQEMSEELFKEIIKDSNGVWGRPSRASVSKGVHLLALIEDSLTDYLQEIFRCRL